MLPARLDRQPVLAGPRLRLRPVAPADRELLYAVASDPAIWAGHPRHDRWRRPVFDALFDEFLSCGGALVVIAGDAIIGASRYDNEVPGRSIEIGWSFLARAQWGTGANAEMKRLMLAHALATVPLVEFRVGEHNAISRRALTNIGARLTDRSDVVEMPDGPVRHLVYEIDRAGFATGPLI